MRASKLPYIFVVGNEKGGVGKTTCSMHLISGLLEQGLTVSSIDLDSRQQSLSTYVGNRQRYNVNFLNAQVAMPTHFLMKESTVQDLATKEQEERATFENLLGQAAAVGQVIVIDTPGTYSFLSGLAHSYANMVITPINDSFIDLDVLAKVDSTSMKVLAPSIYSEMIWNQKLERAKRSGDSINWIIMQNRVATVDTINKRNISVVLKELEQRFKFKIVPGFSERVIFRELFLRGLTLLDLGSTKKERSLSLSHIAARQELKNFFQYLDFHSLKNTLYEHHR